MSAPLAGNCQTIRGYAKQKIAFWKAGNKGQDMSGFVQKYCTHVGRSRRVVVTGLGLVTCLGVGAQHVWKRLLQGECGIGKLTGEEYSQIPCKVAGQVPRGSGPGELTLENYVSVADQRVMSRASVYALVAAEEALSDANWKPQSAIDRERTGVAVGTGMVDMDHIASVAQTFQERGYRRVSPHFIPMVLINMPAFHISHKYGLQGTNHAVSTACTTGLHTIGDASRFIKFGDVDVMVAGGTEASVYPLSLTGFSRLKALSTKFNDDPQKASRPFDKDRDGFVMAEGCGVMVLEELFHAKNRGAKIYGEILGYGTSGDANHLTAPIEDGSGALRCMKNSLRENDIRLQQVGYINAHATSTPLGDEVESKAIHNLFQSHCKNLLVSSTKGATGHLLGGAGSVESIFTVLACQSGKIPPTVNLDQSDISVDLNLVSKKPCDWLTADNGRRIGLSNSFGFGGTNATVCFSNLVH